jgi:hypothetical protein
MNDDRARGCAISNGAHGFTALLPRRQRLPGFDNMAVAHAMGSTANARFVVWRRSGYRARRAATRLSAPAQPASKGVPG